MDARRVLIALLLAAPLFAEHAPTTALPVAPPPRESLFRADDWSGCSATSEASAGQVASQGLFKLEGSLLTELAARRLITPQTRFLPFEQLEAQLQQEVATEIADARDENVRRNEAYRRLVQRVTDLQRALTGFASGTAQYSDWFRETDRRIFADLVLLPKVRSLRAELEADLERTSRAKVAGENRQQDLQDAIEDLKKRIAEGTDRPGDAGRLQALSETLAAEQPQRDREAREHERAIWRLAPLHSSGAIFAHHVDPEGRAKYLGTFEQLEALPEYREWKRQNQPILDGYREIASAEEALRENAEKNSQTFYGKVDKIAAKVALVRELRAWRAWSKTASPTLLPVWVPQEGSFHLGFYQVAGGASLRTDGIYCVPPIADGEKTARHIRDYLAELGATGARHQSGFACPPSEAKESPRATVAEVIRSGSANEAR